jgi:hypothetical protein
MPTWEHIKPTCEQSGPLRHHRLTFKPKFGIAGLSNVASIEFNYTEKSGSNSRQPAYAIVKQVCFTVENDRKSWIEKVDGKLFPVDIKSFSKTLGLKDFDNPQKVEELTQAVKKVQDLCGLSEAQAEMGLNYMLEGKPANSEMRRNAVHNGLFSTMRLLDALEKASAEAKTEAATATGQYKK